MSAILSSNKAQVLATAPSMAGGGSPRINSWMLHLPELNGFSTTATQSTFIIPHIQ